MFSHPGLHQFHQIFNIQACRFGRMIYPIRDKYVGTSLEHYGEFSGGEVALFEKFVRPNELVIDVGANIGAHTLYFARAVGQSGAVLAFEPQRVLFQALCGNMALNNITNVLAFNIALGSASSTVHIPLFDYSCEGNYGGVSIEQFESGEAVNVEPLDKFSFGRCSFIKIDVEGMEKQVIQGAINTIHKHRPILYVENDRKDNSYELLAFLLSLGYRLWWHLPKLFSSHNFFGISENIFPGIVSINVLALPEGVLAPEDLELKPIQDPSDWWEET